MPCTRSRRNSIVPWFWVLAIEVVGLGIPQSANTIGIDPRTWMVAPDWRAVNVTAMARVVP